jgi:predicted O-methyltransferase YrrM
VTDYRARADAFAARAPDRFAELAPPGPEGEQPHGGALLRARYLAALAAATRATYVLAVGDGLAHAAFHVVAGFGHTGHLDLVASDPDIVKDVQAGIARHSFDERMRLHAANAVNVVPSLNGPLDLVIAELAGLDWETLYEPLVRLVRTGGSMALVAPTPGSDGWVARLAEDERLYVHVPETETPILAVRRR